MAAEAPGGGLRGLVRDAGWYGAASVLARALSLVTFPVLTRAFSTADYGAADAVAVAGVALGIFLTLGQDSALARFFHETGDPGERRRIAALALAVESVFCLALLPVLFALADPLVELLVDAPGHGRLMRILVLALPFTLLFNYCRNLLRWAFERAACIALDLASAVVTAAFTLLFVLRFSAGPAGVFYGQLAGMGVSSVLGLVLCRRLLGRPRGLATARRMLAFGWPYMVVGVAEALLPAIDRALVSRVLGLEALGTYAVGWRVAALLAIPLGAFQTAAGPHLLSAHREREGAALYDRILLSYAVLFALGLAATAAASEPLVRVLASARYLDGAAVVFPLGIALVLRGAAGVTGVGIGLSLRSTWHLASYGAGLAATAAGVALLVGPFGAPGAACGVLAGALVQAVVQTRSAYRVHPLRFALGRPAAILGSAAAAGLLLGAVPASPGGLAARGALLAAYASALWLLALAPAERRAVLARGRGAG